jgi:hypothetical protein
LADARTIVAAISRSRNATGTYPRMDRGIEGVRQELQSQFPEPIPIVDIYGQPYIVFVDSEGPAVVSTGRNGFVMRTNSLRRPADGSYPEPFR